ncbi:hypothetical protein ENBRE01_0375 [Enteropsectra breve]|nr:hypothetical protein ENBRE01_0375 [Enteropsectra breve]
MIFLVRLTAVLCNTLYIVQTADDQLHFISDTVESYPLSINDESVPFCKPPKKIKREKMPQAIKTYSDILPAYSKKDETAQYEADTRPTNENKIALQRPTEYDKNSTAILPHTAHNINQSSTDIKKYDFSSAHISPEGRIIYKSTGVPLSKLLSSPVIKNNILFTADKVYTSTFIKNILVLFSNTEVFIRDLESNVDEILKISHVVCLEEEYQPLQICNNQIYLKNKIYSFDSQIVSVFRTNTNSKISYMVKIYTTKADFNKKPGLLRFQSRNEELQNYVNHNGRNHIEEESGNLCNYGTDNDIVHPWTYVSQIGEVDSPNDRIIIVICFSILIFFLVLVMYFRSNIKYKAKLQKHTYAGYFVNQPCIIHEVPKKLCEELSCHKSVAHPHLIHILYQGKRLINYLIITEKSEKLEISKKCEIEENAKVEKCKYFAVKRYKFSKSHKSMDEKPIDIKEFLLKYIKAMEYMNSKGIVHNRICPENFRIDTHGQPKLQAVFSDPKYRSLNIMEGGAPSISDDIFAMGCAVHYFMTGYHPFDGTNYVKHPRKQAVLLTDNENNWKQDVLVTGLTYSIDNFSFEETAGNSKDDKSAGKSSKNNELQNTSDDTINNIKKGTYFIRLSDQIEHDFIYHAVLKGTISMSKHPFFWSYSKMAEFLCDFSDFIETNVHTKIKLEKYKNTVFAGNWVDYLHLGVRKTVSAKRRYDTLSLSELIRFVRNTQRHYQEQLTKDFFEQYEGYVIGYFTAIYPELFLIVYKYAIKLNTDVLAKYLE